MARTSPGPRRALTATSLALVLVVVFASAVIRLLGEDLGGALLVVRGVHRVAASAAALAILAAGWYGWHEGRRAMAVIVVALMLALSVLGAAAGTEPPPLAAAGNLLGGLALAALLAWQLGRERRRGGVPLLHLLAALVALQVLAGAWNTIFEEETWTLVLVGHGTLGFAISAYLAGRALGARDWVLMAIAAAVPLAGFASALLGAPVLAALAHAAAAALLVVAAAWAHGRLT